MIKPQSPGSLLPLALSALLSPLAIAQAPMQLGNLAVLRIGDGVTPNTSAAAPTFLEEWDPNGGFVTPVQPAIAIPTVAVGNQFACTNSGSADSEGQLNLSANGLYLTWGGYDAAVGTATVAASANPTVARVIGRFELFTGTVDTSTAITDGYSTRNIRGVVSDDGTRFWATGSSEGVRYVANLGSLVSSSLTAGNIRHIAIYQNDLYVTQASGSVQGVALVGTGGLPTSTGQSITLLNGFPTASGPSAYGMFWADPNTVYVADSQTGGAGGIQKWTQSGGLWTKQYTLALNPSAGCRTVTGHVQNGVATLYAIANQGSSTQIITVTDTGPASVVTSLLTAPANTVYRGIRLINRPPTLQQFPMACGSANIACAGNGEIGTMLHTKMVNSQGLVPVLALDAVSTFLPLSFVFANCNCTLGTGPNPVLLLTGATSYSLDIQPSWATLGLPVFIQGFDLLTPPGGPCPDFLDLTTTDTFSFTVQ